MLAPPWLMDIYSNSDNNRPSSHKLDSCRFFIMLIKHNTRSFKQAMKQSQLNTDAAIWPTHTNVAIS